MAMSTVLPPGPWRMRLAPVTETPFRWDSSNRRRPIFDIHSADDQWIARVAADTEEQAEAIARAVCGLGGEGGA